ncbi:hypothetical protein SAMN02745751_01609 [Dethiosulfatibacter aminovorans DSM 17477]|uniref:Uncharacterized protein n=2 Tax=Dethiosulfatibacter TaxID=448125 RepID=A0A1M6G037_9FIRM|nr:hypothetical protein SAMN02745751_01609 [Dethiosulfatibacter aminovorans DSM 17477]
MTAQKNKKIVNITEGRKMMNAEKIEVKVIEEKEKVDNEFLELVLDIKASFKSIKKDIEEIKLSIDRICKTMEINEGVNE